MSEQLRILLVAGPGADQDAVRGVLTREQEGWELTIRQCAEQALEHLSDAPLMFDIILADYSLPGISGLAMFQELRGRRVMVPFVMMTNAGTERLAVKAINAGVDNYMIKDGNLAYLELLPIVLLEAVRSYRDRRARQVAEEALRKTHDELEQRVQERTEELSVLNDILRKEMIVRQEAEAALRQSIERFNLAVQGSQDGLWEGRTLPDEPWHSPRTPMWFSSRFQAMLGYGADELPPVLASWAGLLHPDDKERVFQALAQHIEQRVPYDVEYRLRTKGGAYRWFSARGQAVWDEQGRGICMAGSLRDITDRKRAEEALQQSERQLRQAQKMEAIGTLAGGIAHDFNNILSAILGYADLALINAPHKSLIHSYISEVITAGIRARELVRQILAFSRETEQERQSVDLQVMVSEALRLLRPALPTSIAIRLSTGPEPEPCIVSADPTQIHQVLMNLCTNAESAMREGGGVLEIGVRLQTVSEPLRVGLTRLSPGEYAKLTVCDTGKGMTSDILDRIFEPFFTTKPLGEGTGMGLAVVHGIIVGHGGAITVSSVPEKGSKFEIFIPCLKSTSPVPQQDELSLPRGEGRILFVDDEETIARWGEQLLTYLGYDVVLETCAEKALETFRRGPFDYDIVITDQTMPSMTGEMLARQILKIRKDIPIVLCTGYSHAMSLEKSEAMGIRAFLMKPVKGQQLAMTLQNILMSRERRCSPDSVS